MATQVLVVIKSPLKPESLHQQKLAATY